MFGKYENACPKKMMLEWDTALGPQGPAFGGWAEPRPMASLFRGVHEAGVLNFLKIFFCLCRLPAQVFLSRFSIFLPFP